MKNYHIENPFILTIFGASGDLAKLKIFPALYNLIEQKRLPKEFYIIGFARTAKSQEEFRQEFKKSISEKAPHHIKPSLLDELVKKVYYFEGQYDDIKSFKAYKDYVKKVTQGQKMTHIAYCSVPPQTFKAIIQNLGETKIPKEDLRIVIEKPFGQDLASATDLFHFLARYFDEEHTYLLDHYLGKSAVQSILHLRHSNRILNQMLKGTEIANIQITAFEDTGVSSRIGYFDQVGILKDMVQSHLLQLLALTTMSIPITEAATSLHREKNSILSALNFPKAAKNIVLGQYQGYKKEKDVPKNSNTETFVALRLYIDRESWYRVPIYIRTGKKLHEKHTYIAIELKKFKFQSKDEAPNLLILELHPSEKISIKLLNKNNLGETKYSAVMSTAFMANSENDILPEHSILLLDVIHGRKTHFLSFPEIIASWSVTEAMLHCIDRHNIPVEIYKDNSLGPISQDQLTAMDNFTWHDLH